MKRIQRLIIVSFAILVFLSGIIIYKSGGINQTAYKVLSKTVYRSRNLEVNKITFLGDSIVDRCNLKALFNADIVNEGVSGNTTADILNRLDEVINLKPSTLFLHFGVNDLRQVKGQTNEVNIDNSIKNYSEIIDTIKSKLPNTKIYIENVLPVDNNIIAEKAKTDNIYNFYIDNKDIDVFNTKLEQLALKNNITYIKHLTFNPNTETVDGIHPNIEGYLILKKDLEQYVSAQ